MTREHAEAIASILKGEAFHSGGNVWLVRIRTPRGHLVVIAEDCVAEYPSDVAYDHGEHTRLIGWLD